VFEYKITKKKADHNKANAPRGRDEGEIWVHYTYYYYPDIELYLQVETGIWFFREGQQWRSAALLPGKLKKMQMQTRYKVKLNYTGCNPTLLHRMNKTKFPARPRQKGKKHSMMKEKKRTRTHDFYIPVNRSDLVSYEIDHIEMNFYEN
jgi:hypothetical protein